MQQLIERFLNSIGATIEVNGPSGDADATLPQRSTDAQALEGILPDETPDGPRLYVFARRRWGSRVLCAYEVRPADVERYLACNPADLEDNFEIPVLGTELTLS